MGISSTGCAKPDGCEAALERSSDQAKQGTPVTKCDRTIVSPKGAAISDASAISSTSTAVALIEEGNALQEQGRISEAMARYDAAVQTDPNCARAHLNRGNVLLASGKIEEARRAYELAIACNPQYAGAHFNLGNLNSQVEEHESALRNYQAAVAIDPEFANAFVAMGNLLDTLRRTPEAKVSYERALAINPDDAGVHFNLALLATTEMRYEDAVERLSAAVHLRPDYAAAHYQLGRALSSLGRLDAAEASLRTAWSLTPETEAILYDLAAVLLARSKSPEAVQMILRTLERAPTWQLKTAFAACVMRSRSATNDTQLRTALTAAISEPWASPYKLIWPALSLIMLDPRIASCVQLANQKWPTRVPKTSLFGTHGLTTLAADPLVRAVLTAAPVNTIEFERFLTVARHALLEIAISENPPAASDIAALPFYSALTQQCFINEYIFDCDDSERAAAAACRAKLLGLLDSDTIVPPLLLLAVAAYFPLHTLPEPTRLFRTNQQQPVEEVLRQQVREPLEERALRAGVECLTPITHGVSEKVRDQYEHNPYPRWVKLPIYQSALHFNAELRRTFPLAPLIPLHDDSRPELLIAGCGTGSQPILAAQRFRGVSVLAVDLSLSSIAYAIRKTRELGITNIRYAQADILKLSGLARTFDIIASVGVLHHLADPFIGWRNLLSLLRPGGFMQLGFYSQVARRHIVRAREFVAARGYGSEAEHIRRFRRDIADLNAGTELHWMSQTQDFYSTSECRDLAFHVQEHCLTLAQIESFVFESGLHFVGFELDPRVLQQYRTRFPNDPAGTNLRNWTHFEADNPDTFTAMYQFWIQKPD
jgi:tetratricopeptide (TPR) repeat protein/SAM-dependent methyltransferase